jgi:acyl-CoA synthetase (NDP forming)
VAHDFCDDLGLELPPLSAQTESTLKRLLPAFATVGNPLDLTTQPLWQPELMHDGSKALLDDPVLGSLVISIPPGGPAQSVRYLTGLIAATEGSTKPVILSLLGDTAPLAPEFLDLAHRHRIILSRSVERSLRAMAQVTAYGRSLAQRRSLASPVSFHGLPALRSGPHAEWTSKKLLAAAGVRIPAGELASSLDQALEIAGRIGYPVAMKAQAAALAHKTEAGGVLLDIEDEASVRRAWPVLITDVRRACPGLELEGVLVEKMVSRGIELVIGAKRDPQWGPAVLVGLGGVWVEAIADVRVLPPDLAEEAIVEELWKLRAARVLRGARQLPPVDVEAVGHAVSRVGQLMQAVPDIIELDINPLVAHPRGEGVTALDAFLVVR